MVYMVNCITFFKKKTQTKKNSAKTLHIDHADHAFLQTIKKELSMYTTFIINKNMIQHETTNALLAKLPQTDWKVWLSKKFLRRGTHSANLSVSVDEEYSFEIFRSGKGKYNFTKKIDSRQITGKELSEKCGVQG